MRLNQQFPRALKLSEVRAIAKSVAKWTWRKFSVLLLCNLLVGQARRIFRHVVVSILPGAVLPLASSKKHPRIEAQPTRAVGARMQISARRGDVAMA